MGQGEGWWLVSFFSCLEEIYNTFAVKLHKCFVDFNTSSYFPTAYKIMTEYLFMAELFLKFLSTHVLSRKRADKCRSTK